MDKLICFVDKSGPPKHSFIDGLLAKRINEDFDVYIYSSWKKGISLRSRPYHTATLRSVLFPRIGLLRFFNIFLCALICLFYACSARKNRIIVLCRNEPSYLLGAVLVSFIPHVEVVFQSSFPHESVAKGMKAYIAKKIFNICSYRVRKVIAVSPQGLERVLDYFNLAEGLVVPLMSDHCVCSFRKELVREVRFVYIGTMDPSRQFELVVRSFIKAANLANKPISLHVYGGSQAEWDRILYGLNINKKRLDDLGIFYLGSIDRDDLLCTIQKYDVGISLVPRNNITWEMSPTKLTEYMGCGLAVIASNTVDSQVKIVCNANCGMLCEFEFEEIVDAICRVCEQDELLREFKKNSLEFVRDNYTYDAVKADFVGFLRSC